MPKIDNVEVVFTPRMDAAMGKNGDQAFNAMMEGKRLEIELAEAWDVIRTWEESFADVLLYVRRLAKAAALREAIRAQKSKPARKR